MATATATPTQAPKRRGRPPGSGKKKAEDNTFHIGESTVKVPKAIYHAETHATRVPLDQLVPSPTNPRKTYPEPGIASLAQSIVEAGLGQRLLVRPRGKPKGPAPAIVTGKDGTSWANVDHYEVICGHRRRLAILYARKHLGLKMDLVKVDVADLSDTDVRIMQAVENDQREDLIPSEQAASYAALVAECGLTAEEVANRTGKGLGFVRNLLRLARLPKNVLAAIDAGTISRDTGAALSRLYGDAQKSAAAYILAGKSYYDESDPYPKLGKLDPLTSREAAKLIRDAFQIELKSARFGLDVVNLVEGVGSCKDCPKRAGNDPDATEAGLRADMCLDTACYNRKDEAWDKKIVAEAKAAGRKVLTNAEMKGLWNYSGDQLQYGSDWVDLDRVCYQDNRNRTYRQLFSKSEGVDPHIAVAVDKHGTPHFLVPAKVAESTLKRDYKFGSSTSSAKTSKPSTPAEIKREKERAAKERLERQIFRETQEAILRTTACAADELFTERWLPGSKEVPANTLASSIGGMKSPVLTVLLALCREAIASFWGLDAVAKRRGCKGKSTSELRAAMSAQLGEFGAVGMLAFLTEIHVARHCLGNGADKAQKELLEALGVDKKAIEAQVKTRLGGKPTRKVSAPAPEPTEVADWKDTPVEKIAVSQEIRAILIGRGLTSARQVHAGRFSFELYGLNKEQADELRTALETLAGIEPTDEVEDAEPEPEELDEEGPNEDLDPADADRESEVA